MTNKRLESNLYQTCILFFFSTLIKVSNGI